MENIGRIEKVANLKKSKEYFNVNRERIVHIQLDQQ